MSEKPKPYLRPALDRATSAVDDTLQQHMGRIGFMAATLDIIRSQAEAAIAHGGDSLPAEWLINRCNEALDYRP